ncbi:MAG TPA: hypothetical protein VGO50_05415 [Pyrinomonadaceae bacterium]|jgi:hypothetical protein|nr:hypothetical protein [Pyrinomonadaceae bacterium]
MFKWISVLLVIFLTMIIAHGENSVVLTQKTAPLKITKYEAKFQDEIRGSYVSHPDQVSHTVTCQNISGKVIVAYQIGLVAFDAFNSLMGKFNGWAIKDIPVDGNGDGTWEQRPYAAFSFEKFGTGVAYVNAVRFEDGAIWRADIAEVLIELQKFEKDLKKEDLQEKKTP